LLPAYISKLGSTKLICGVMDKVVAIKFKIDFIKVALPFTQLPDKFPPNKAATLAADHKNKDMVPVLVLLLVGVPVGFGKPAPRGSLANEEA
jgi:hypothetical protein